MSSPQEWETPTPDKPSAPKPSTNSPRRRINGMENETGPPIWQRQVRDDIDLIHQKALSAQGKSSMTLEEEMHECARHFEEVENMEPLAALELARREVPRARAERARRTSSGGEVSSEGNASPFKSGEYQKRLQGLNSSALLAGDGETPRQAPRVNPILNRVKSSTTFFSRPISNSSSSMPKAELRRAETLGALFASPLLCLCHMSSSSSSHEVIPNQSRHVPPPSIRVVCMHVSCCHRWDRSKISGRGRGRGRGRLVLLRACALAAAGPPVPGRSGHRARAGAPSRRQGGEGREEAG